MLLQAQAHPSPRAACSSRHSTSKPWPHRVHSPSLFPKARAAAAAPGPGLGCRPLSHCITTRCTSSHLCSRVRSGQPHSAARAVGADTRARLIFDCSAPRETSHTQEGRGHRRSTLLTGALHSAHRRVLGNAGPTGPLKGMCLCSWHHEGSSASRPYAGSSIPASSAQFYPSLVSIGQRGPPCTSPSPAAIRIAYILPPLGVYTMLLHRLVHPLRLH